MKLVKPSVSPSLGTSRDGLTRTTHRRPEWLKEWIANKSKYVLLACGHKENIAEADSAITLIQTFKECQLYCWRCKDFSAIEESISFLEYLGIPKPEYPDTPPF